MRNRKADEQLGRLGYGLILLFIIGLCAAGMAKVVMKDKQPIINRVKYGRGTMIPIEKEGRDMYLKTKVYEVCYFCNKETDTWHNKTNNPVCSRCAKEHKVSELPNRYKKA